MEQDREHLQLQADRARWWAASISDPWDRDRLEAIARDYEGMALAVEQRVNQRLFSRQHVAYGAEHCDGRYGDE